RLDSSLGVRHVQIANLRNGHRRAGRMSIGRGIATFARLSELLGGNLARVVWGHLANAAERKPARTPFPAAILDDIRDGASRLHANAEALERTGACIPLEHVAGGAVRPQRIDKALGDPGHVGLGPASPTG